MNSAHAGGQYQDHMDKGRYAEAEAHARKKASVHEAKAATYRETNSRIKKKPVSSMEEMADNHHAASQAASASYAHKAKAENWTVKAEKAAAKK